MNLFVSWIFGVLTFSLHIFLSAASAEADAALRQPFVSREEAHQMLGQSDLGRYKGLTARLGLRADMEYGWEEFATHRPTLHGNTKMSRIEQLEDAVRSVWVRQADRVAVSDTILLGSLTRLGRVAFTPPHRLHTT